MSDDAMQTVLRVHYRRQIQPKQYETAEFSMDVEHSFPMGMSPDEIMKAAGVMATEVKVAVFDQLGLNYSQDDETRIVMEVFPDSQKVTSLPRSAPVAAPEAPSEPVEPAPAARRRATAAKPAAARRRAPAGRDARLSDDEQTIELWEDLVANPGNWFDNTQDKPNPRAPDFRATNKSGIKSADGRFPAGLWLNTCPEDLVLPDDGYANS